MKSAGTRLHHDGPWGNPQNQEEGFRPKEKLDSFFKSPQFDQFFSGGNKSLWAIVGIVFLGAWIGSGFYQVNPDEEGIVLRFGKWIRTTEPGWHYHLPYPVEVVLKPKVTTTNQINIGFGSQDESLMLTGDRNIVDASVIVQWHIKDAGKYLFNLRDPQETIKAVTESALREIIGQTPIDSTFAEGRAEIQQSARALVQQILDSFQAGVQVTAVNLKNVNPPQPVIEAFREVDRAYSDQERLLNEAETYRNDIVPKARGEASQILADGKGYQESIVAQAKGSTQRFLSVLKEYKKAPAVTSQRLYLETMEKVLQEANKVIMDSKAAPQGMLPHMALPTLQNKIS
jgi:membrane protease subunit HflK